MGVKVYDGFKVNDVTNQLINDIAASSPSSSNFKILNIIYKIFFTIPFVDMVIYFCLFILVISAFYRVASTIMKLILKLLFLFIIITTIITLLNLGCYSISQINDDADKTTTKINQEETSSSFYQSTCENINYQLSSSMIASKILTLVSAPTNAFKITYYLNNLYQKYYVDDSTTSSSSSS
ncbi:MAG: hypothetical protein MUO21_09585, partial [Nitrososphaeraceae archaeon]|nr:hypothetical protein [Nitrososphaeraceae archaeon]